MGLILIFGILYSLNFSLITTGNLNLENTNIITFIRIKMFYLMEDNSCDVGN